MPTRWRAPKYVRLHDLIVRYVHAAGLGTLVVHAVGKFNNFTQLHIKIYLGGGWGEDRAIACHKNF